MLKFTPKGSVVLQKVGISVIELLHCRTRLSRSLVIYHQADTIALFSASG